MNGTIIGVTADHAPQQAFAPRVVLDGVTRRCRSWGLDRTATPAVAYAAAPPAAHAPHAAAVRAPQPRDRHAAFPVQTRSRPRQG